MRFIAGLLVGVVFSSTLLISFSNSPTPSNANVINEMPQTIQVDPVQLEWLSKAIYFEARGESLASMLAVGLVVENRIHDGRYPDNVKDVVTQSKKDPKGNVIPGQCQFSWYCDGKPDEPDRKSASWAKAKDAARAILENEVFDFTDGATHFHNGTVAPNWGFPKVAQIDNHSFYRRTR